MDDLYRYIDTARKYSTPPEGVPIKDMGTQVGTGLDWAKRQQAPAEPPPVQQLKPIVPVAN